MKKLFALATLLVVASMILAACGGAPATTAAPAATEKPAEVATEAPAEEPAATEAPAEEPASGEKVKIRWFVGLGTGTNAEQVAVQEEVVADFNASQDKIELVLEIVPYESARDTLATQIASDAGPDIVGPVGWVGSNSFYGQWLDIAPYIKEIGFDTSIFDPALSASYQTEEGLVGLPFAVFPGAIYFRPDLFDEAGLAYPPQKYGDKYVLDGEEVDWTWDVVTEVAKRLTVDKNGKNATEEGFDRTAIVQVGYNAQWQGPMSVATFYAGAADVVEGSKKGEFKPAYPDSWKGAWKWYYDGIWGEQPFMASGPLAGSPEFGAGNVFNSGKAAMGLTQTWYTCCLGEFVKAGYEFQLGIQPIGADGKVHGRIDADTFRIWKGTKNPKEAVEVLAYLVTTGGDKLLPIYGAMPAIASKTDAFFAQKSKDYPFVTEESWNVFVQGLAYPDSPSAEQYQPNLTEVFARIGTFGDLMNNTEDLDFDAEYQKLMEDLEVIYNK